MQVFLVLSLSSAGVLRTGPPEAEAAEATDVAGAPTWAAPARVCSRQAAERKNRFICSSEREQSLLKRMERKSAVGCSERAQIEPKSSN